MSYPPSGSFEPHQTGSESPADQTQPLYIAVDEHGVPLPTDDAGMPLPIVPPRRRRRWPWLVLLVFVLAAGIQGIFALKVWRSVERLPVAGALSAAPSDGVNYLIVGSDSREGVAADDPNAGAILGGGLSGERTDTIVIVNVASWGNTMMAVPRDLYVELAGTGERQRINAAIQGGPERLVQTLQNNLGIPIHHLVRVDFGGLVGLVDALGGVTIDFPHAAYDTRSGFAEVPAGSNTLDGAQALAFVRSRFFTEVIDGSAVVDGRSDLGRVERQQDFLRAVLGEVVGIRNPITLNRAAWAMADDIAIDDSLSLRDSLWLARRLGGSSPESVVLPVSPTTTSGGAQVLELRSQEAQPVLDRFR